MNHDTHFDVAEFEQIFVKIERSHGKNARKIVEEAYAFMKKAHEGQKRKGGADFWTHPAAVATILVSQGHTDPELIAAALMHDTVEDTKVTLDQIEEKFGSSIRYLVNGATNVGCGDGADYIEDKIERMAATQEKVLELGQKDMRIFLLKSADRLHNLKTLGAMPDHKRKRIRAEARNFHVPIARKAGQDELAMEIEKLAND